MMFAAARHRSAATTKLVDVDRIQARRAFERRFSLADHIKVVGASLVNGMLHVDLTREVPEASKPRKIQIVSGQPEQATTAQHPEVTKQAA